MRIVNMNNDICCSKVLNAKIIELEQEVINLKKTIKEIGGEDLYNYLYKSKNSNQIELFDEH